MQEASRIRLTGWTPFWWPTREEIQPRPAGDVIEAWLGQPGQQRWFHDAAHSDFWWAHPEGKLFLLRGYIEDSIGQVQPATGIDITLPIWRVGEILLYAARLAQEFGEDTEILARCRYTGLRHRRLISIEPRQAVSDAYRSVDDDVVLEEQIPTNRIEDNLVEVIHPLLLPLYERFSFYELPVFLVTQELERLRSSRF